MCRAAARTAWQLHSAAPDFCSADILNSLTLSGRPRHREARHRPLADRPVDDGGADADADRNPPHQIVVALDVVEAPGAPAAEEAAELMTEEHDAPQYRQVG